MSYRDPKRKRTVWYVLGSAAALGTILLMRGLIP